MVCVRLWTWSPLCDGLCVSVDMEPSVLVDVEARGPQWVSFPVPLYIFFLVFCLGFSFFLYVCFT